MTYDWSSDISLLYVYDMYVQEINPLQVAILAFRVDWLIHGVTHALNTMKETFHLKDASEQLSDKIIIFSPVMLTLKVRRASFRQWFVF